MLNVRGEDYKGAVDQIGKAIEHYKPKPGRKTGHISKDT